MLCFPEKFVFLFLCFFCIFKNQNLFVFFKCVLFLDVFLKIRIYVFFFCIFYLGILCFYQNLSIF